MFKSLDMSKLHKWIAILLMIGGLGFTFLAGFVARGWSSGRVDVNLLQEAYALLETHYIEELPESNLLQRGMVRGMIDALNDPFTQYVEPKQHAIQSDNLAGEYGGIGALITIDGGGNFFIAPFPGGPADKSGISEGTQLLAVDGVSLTDDLLVESVIALLRGPRGTRVDLHVRRPGEDRAETILLIRENIPLPSVTYYIIPSHKTTGVVAINAFTVKTPGEVEASLNNLLDRGVQRVILDLRNNGGGLLESAVKVSRLFLREGMIVAEERKEGIQQSHFVEESGRYLDQPMVVLVDGSTASAAEVVAAALQSNERAEIIGDRTFGKGSVQVVVELTDGSSLRITSSRWLTPDGELIDETGLVPDIQIEPGEAASEQALIFAAEWFEGKGQK